MFKLTAALLVVTAATTDAAKPKWHQLDNYTFEKYVSDFGKPYCPKANPSSYGRRKANFEKNIKHIQTLNADGKRKWNAGVNMFSDMSNAEFKKFNKYKRSSMRTKPARIHSAPTANDPALPIEVDWRMATAPRVLTAVKHQGSCGSCWAHSAIESIESQYALLTGMLPVLSVAQINSCTPISYDSQGCNGGSYVGAWNFMANRSVHRPAVLKSVTEEWAYPISASDWFFADQPNGTVTTACRDISKEWITPATSWFAELSAAGVTGYGMVESNSPFGGPAAQKALQTVGPLSVGVAANGWQWYESGIYTTPSPSAPSDWGVDHAVQMVGYGYDKELDTNYWIIRNSWSTLYGEGGFIRLYRGKDGEEELCSDTNVDTVCGTCGVLSEPAYPIVIKATPTHFN